MSETRTRPVTVRMVLGIIGLGAFSAVFLGAMFIGMSIDPRVDMTSRLIAYTTALGGLALALACRWTLATTPTERKIFAAAALLMSAFSIVYGLVML